MRVPPRNPKDARYIACSGGAFLRDETRTGSTRLDGGHDAVVVVAVDAVRRSWPSTKTVTAGHLMGLRELGSGIDGGPD